jgi:hypothetical protein
MTIARRIVLLLTCAVFVVGCNDKAVPIAPRQPAQGDTWCQYNITRQSAACGKNRVGETICILCTQKFAPNQLCPNPPKRLVVSPSEKCELELLPLAPGQQQCENCTAREGGTYQVSSTGKPGVP